MASQVQQGEIVVTGQRYPKVVYIFIPSDRDSTPVPPVDNDTDSLPPVEGGGGSECTPLPPGETKAAEKFLAGFKAGDLTRQIEGLDRRKEWGSAIYITKDGVLGNTPFRTATDFRAQIAWDADPAEAKVIAFAHSHPARQLEPSGAETNYWFPLDTGYLLRPSPNRVHNGQIIGDWIAYDSAVAYTGNQDMLMIIIGDTSSNGATPMGINMYGPADKGYVSPDYNLSPSPPKPDEAGRNPVDRNMPPAC